MCGTLVVVSYNKFKTAQKRTRSKKISSGGQKVSEKLYFVRQHVGMACGSIAVIHAIANNRSLIKLEDFGLAKFLENTKDKDPEERGHMLGTDENITSAHKTVSLKGQTNPDDFVKTDFHFICFTQVDGSLYELDGTKKFPINHGPTSKDSLLKDAAKVIQTEFVDKNPGELFFSLIALAPSTGEQEILEVPPKKAADESMEQLMNMGFAKDQAEQALQLSNGNLAQAVNYLLTMDK